MSRSYGQAEWREDLKRFCRKAGAEDKPSVFLFSDSQIKVGVRCQTVMGGQPSDEEEAAISPGSLFATHIVYMCLNGHRLRPQMLGHFNDGLTTMCPCISNLAEGILCGGH